MKFILNNSVDYVLVLGAGASVDYGLPVWRDLGLLMREKINGDKENRYQYKKEMLVWLDKVGEGKNYNTIDQCIKEEAVSKEYHSNGHKIENQTFLVIKDIFDETYKESDGGWIRILNEKVLSSTTAILENKIAFINYNYDNVLDKNFLNFTYLPAKHQIFNHKRKLGALSGKYVSALFPHGNLFLEQESENPSHIYKQLNTMKSGNKEHVDAVSCYESESHDVLKYNYGAIKLYILGLGGGLEMNLNNINFETEISEIHVTIKDHKIKDEVINFLSKKYGLPATDIKIYETCKELVNKCF